ncbi:ABC transporter ATP-binding protein [Roseateles asaccharophilus]|uniref:ABC-type nitrate/sulfonate/bicarbonate transport system ATPase subunit n=1 Tax=Roseateles asaccharophilus TaxID=582607 RepID=A0ABU2A8J7_9BURK|nr:ABC transporter ATP-binding protein [Roseateles asaccharophilus]MDR7333489.1 ABC-type nitrate/sulfonate/bicarbonate transport system ATPase subunit [Roseateles asaccharophilus]
MKPKICVKGLTKGFRAAKGGLLPVIAGVDFEVGEGQFVAIVGPSGCGKSTLMNILAGFEKPDGGQLLIDGRPHPGPSPQGIVISQYGSVFPWLTVQQNLMFGLTGEKAGDAALADHYAAMVGLKGFENAYPHELSGGMLKRVELARAFIVKPEILYLDEPFSALDALMNLRMRNELLRILAEEKHTVLLITHDVDEALYMADHIFVLSPRPTRIQARFELDMPHPRRLISPEMDQLREAILKELGLEMPA